MRGPFAHFRTLRTYAGILGWSAAFRVRLHDTLLRHFNFRPPFEIQLKLKNVSYPLRMRTGKSSDRQVLNQIFLEPEYEARLPREPNHHHRSRSECWILKCVFPLALSKRKSDCCGA